MEQWACDLWGWGVGEWQGPSAKSAPTTLVLNTDPGRELAYSGKDLTQVFLFPYLWSSTWSNLSSEGDYFLASLYANCLLPIDSVCSTQCQIPPPSLPLYHFLLRPLLSCQPPTATCLVGLLHLLSFWKLDIKSIFKSLASKACRKSSLRPHAL